MRAMTTSRARCCSLTWKRSGRRTSRRIASIAAAIVRSAAVRRGSARKSSPDAESGFRYLACSLCGLEWNVNRIFCPSCFEEDPAKLPSFQSDAYPTVRIEACETCRRYVKSIDMTIDARPIPEIDELLSLSMDLWAVDEGYTRIEPGMAGL